MRKTFTLIELIVVIAIIAVLAAIIAPNAFNAIEKAKIAQAASDFKTLKRTWATLYVDVGKFPTDIDYGGGNHRISETDLLSNVLSLPGWDGPYLERAPHTPWGGEYVYDRSGDPDNCYHGSGSRGINLLWYNADTSIKSIDQFRNISLRLAALLDSDNDDARGGFRRVAIGSPSESLRFLIDNDC